MTAKKLFQKTFHGQKNFMTPKILSTRYHGRFAVEISTGEGIHHQPIYGVTVLEKDTGKTRADLGLCTPSRLLVERYCTQLGTLKDETLVSPENRDIRA